MTVEERLRHFELLFNTARILGWGDRLAEGEDEVRRRWQRLREVTLERKQCVSE